MDKDCKLCEIIRSWIWAAISVPAMFFLFLPVAIYGLILGTCILLLGKHIIRSEAMARYGWNALISIDQLGNAITGGDPDETISSRAGKRQHDQYWAKCLCWLLNKLDTNHCKDAMEQDEGNDEVLK